MVAISLFSLASFLQSFNADYGTGGWRPSKKFWRKHEAKICKLLRDELGLDVASLDDCDAHKSMAIFKVTKLLTPAQVRKLKDAMLPGGTCYVLDHNTKIVLQRNGEFPKH